MKKIKACLSLLLAFALLFTSVPTYALAEKASDAQQNTETASSSTQQNAEITASNTDDDTTTTTFSQINPIYEDVLSLEDIQEQPGSAPDASSPYSAAPYAASGEETEDLKTFSDDLEAADHIRQELEKRSAVISFIYVTTEHYSTNSEYKALFDKLFELGLEETGVPTEGDYIRFQWGHWGGEISTGSDDEGNYYYHLTYNMTYYTTQEQEQVVSEEVLKVLNQLELEGKTTFEKIKAIYHYLVTTVTYDYDNLEDTSYLLKYTAYAALINKTAICQGYAVAFYRLLMEADIPVRVIRGVSGNENHAWNIAELDNYWYNVDSTWDSGSYPEEGIYSWFLLNQDSFTNHVRDDMYQKKEFNAAYPMGSDNYTIDISDKKAVLKEDNLAYNGAEQTPEVTVPGLTEEYDFKVSCSNNIHAGTATATITGINGYTGSINLPFTINQAQNVWTAQLTCRDVVYGNKPKPSASASFGEVTYTYSSSENGTYTDEIPADQGTWYVKATVNETADYTGLTSVIPFEIKETVDISNEKASLSEDTFTYDGTEKTPVVAIAGLVEGTDFTVVYDNNIHAGTALATATGINGYVGSIPLEFTINQAQNTWTSELTCKNITYGSKPKPSASASFGKATYTYSSSKDGTYTDKVPTAVGTWYVKATVAKTADYTGLTAIASFKIKAKDMSDVSVKGFTGYYDGKSHSIKVTAPSGTKVTYSTSKSGSYSSKNPSYKKAGTYKIYYKITRTGYNTVSGSAAIKIKLKQPNVAASNTASGVKIKWSKISGATGYRIYKKTSEGWKRIKTITSGSTVTWTHKDVKNGSRYVYTVYAYNDNVRSTYMSGKTTYRLTRPTISSLKNSGSKKMTVKWNRNTKATGYQIQYSTNSSFSSYKTTSVGKNSTLSKTISSLTKGKRYYVRVRAYKTVSDKKYYSAWSAAKNVKISK